LGNVVTQHPLLEALIKLNSAAMSVDSREGEQANPKLESVRQFSLTVGRHQPSHYARWLKTQSSK